MPRAQSSVVGKRRLRFEAAPSGRRDIFCVVDDVTSRSYLDLARLDWLTGEVQKVADWIEQQAAIAASKNVVQLHASGAA